MTDRTCSIDDCDETVRARGWCNTHYACWRRTGSPLPLCKDEGCAEPVVAGGRCGAHYRAAFPEGRPCGIAGCPALTGIPGTGLGLCSGHYQSQKRYDDQATHLECNLRKRVKGTDQLRLFG